MQDVAYPAVLLLKVVKMRGGREKIQIIMGILVFMMIISWLATGVRAQDNYSYVTKWGTYGEGEGEFRTPVYATVDAVGNIYVTESRNNRVQIFDNTGQFISTWKTRDPKTGKLFTPKGIASDASGNIYLTDTSNHRVWKFSRSGVYINNWGGYGEKIGQFIYPHDVAVDGAGFVYVTDENNHRVQKFTGGGTYITSWGSLGSGEGQFSAPTGITVDISGNVYVADNQNHRIQKFTDNGIFITSWGMQGSDEGQLYWPWGIEVDDAGGVYVADLHNNRIQKFSSNGTFITAWGRYGTEDGEFIRPMSVAVNGDGSWVYVVDSDNSRIQMFTTIPVILHLTYSPKIPITGPEKKTTFSAIIAKVPGYEICGLEWDFMNGTEDSSHPEERFGGKTNQNYSQEKTWQYGNYGNKQLEVKLFGKKTGENHPYLLDQKEIDFKVFFPMGGPSDWKTNIYASPLSWRKDPSIPTNEPNWYYYWKRDSAIEKIDLTTYDPGTGSAGYYNSSNSIIALGPAAPTLWKTIILNTGLEPGGETIGGTVGITGATATIFHELHHERIRFTRKSGLFSGLEDSDYNISSLRYYYSSGGRLYHQISNDNLPDGFENGTLTTEWEPLGSLTDINHTDTYNFRTHFDQHYITYGDEEYLCYREENRALGRVEGFTTRFDYVRDWSDGGRMAEEQAESTIPPTLGGEHLTTTTIEQAILLSEETDELGFLHFVDYGLDTNGNGLFNHLIVDVTLSVDNPGTYTLYGNLTDEEGTFIASSSYRVPLATNGTFEVSLQFNGSEIHKSERDGPYILNVILSESGGREAFILDSRIDAHTTEVYSLSQFEGAQISLAGTYADFAIDSDGDGTLDILRIDTGLAVTKPGAYKVSAALYGESGHLTTTFYEGELYNGDEIVHLTFNGRIIGIQRINGPYELRDVVVMSGENIQMDYNRSPYWTHAYSAEDFLPPPPDAAFIASPNRGVAPLTVQFTDTSSRNPDAFRWDYSTGDGWRGFSVLKNPSYTFFEPGNYSIRLTTKNDGGRTTYTQTDIISVHTQGDFNGNDRIDIGDVSKVAWMALGLIEPDKAADFNGDGTVNAADAAWIAYYYVGKIGEL